jgi:hypothetical protein
MSRELHPHKARSFKLRLDSCSILVQVLSSLKLSIGSMTSCVEVYASYEFPLDSEVRGRGDLSMRR